MFLFPTMHILLNPVFRIRLFSFNTKITFKNPPNLNSNNSKINNQIEFQSSFGKIMKYV